MARNTYPLLRPLSLLLWPNGLPGPCEDGGSVEFSVDLALEGPQRRISTHEYIPTLWAFQLAGYSVPSPYSFGPLDFLGLVRTDDPVEFAADLALEGPQASEGDLCLGCKLLSRVQLLHPVVRFSIQYSGLRGGSLPGLTTTLQGSAFPSRSPVEQAVPAPTNKGMMNVSRDWCSYSCVASIAHYTVFWQPC